MIATREDARTAPLAYFAAVAYAIAAVVQKGIGFLVFVWLAHMLSVEEYAAFGLLFALQTGLAALAGAGVPESLIGLLRDHPSDAAREHLFSAGNGVFLLFASLSVAIVVLARPDFLVRASGSSFDLLFVATAGALTAFFLLQAFVTRLQEDHFSSLLLGFFPPLSSWLAGFALFSIQPTVSAFFAGCALGFVVSLFVFRATGVGYYRFSIRYDELRPILARITPFVLVGALLWLSGYGNVYLVKGFFQTVDVARFTFAYTLASLMQLMASSMNQVWSPRFYRLVHELPLDEVERRSRRFFVLEGAVVGLIGGVVLAATPFLMDLAGEPLAPYRDMTFEFLLMFTAYAVSIPWFHVQNYYYVHARGAELMQVTLLTTLFGISAWILAMLFLGVVGVYAGFALMAAVRAFGATLRARRHWPIRIAYEGPCVAVLLLGSGAFAQRFLV